MHLQEAQDLMNANSAQEVVTVMVMFGALWFLGGLAMVGLWTKKKYGMNSKTKSDAHRKVAAVSILGHNAGGQLEENNSY